ncbi:hypothetical protein I302_100485 [Kwoniella bestiolae CBS 10118]|uniref:Uncharacterized protein n=1 Tax=Kwoniella bestiolae CBS 10118 TaxID=1296100 RepID=A0A1B9G5A1_9TREE|nr:hypothetical protein I302_03858 [Kwoniella bestiolae CBS 10118]OCF26180.1 hypothetical protein I302_03858 [Kwoniella bestiolae CBS 10118]
MPNNNQTSSLVSWTAEFYFTHDHTSIEPITGLPERASITDPLEARGNSNIGEEVEWTKNMLKKGVNSCETCRSSPSHPPGAILSNINAQFTFRDIPLSCPSCHRVATFGGTINVDPPSQEEAWDYKTSFIDEISKHSFRCGGCGQVRTMTVSS